MLIIRLGLILMFIGAIASGGLALLNRKTAPIIAEFKARQQAEARIEVMQSAGGVDFRPDTLKSGEPFWRAYDADGKLVGYVGMAYGKGYSSTIETVCGFDTDFKVTGIKITFQQETPGLGTKSVEIKKGDERPWFQRQFTGKPALELAVTKDRGEIDSITGATITSRAVTNSVRAAAREISDTIASRPVETTPGVAATNTADPVENPAEEVEK